MTKKDLINEVAKKRGCSKTEASEIVNDIIEIMEDELTGGGTVKLSGFGVLSSKMYAAKAINSPIIDGVVEVPAKYVVKFKSSKVLEKKVNE